MRNITAESLGGRHWCIWAAFCLIIVLIHSSTLAIDHLVNQDEVQILDLGRTVLHPNTDWALSWDVNVSHAILPISYIGPAIQELAYQATAQSMVGPRITAIFSAIFAATALLGWLNAKGFGRKIVFLLAMVFLLDPMFAYAYRQGRIDGWAMAAAIFSCWQLVEAKKNLILQKNWKKPLVISAVALTVSPFFWPSAFILMPLVALELLLLCKSACQSCDQNPKRLKLLISIGLIFVATCVATSILLLLPIATHWEKYWQSIQSMAVVQSAASVSQTPVHQLFLVYDPFLFIAVLIALLIHRDYWLITALAVALTMVQFTMIYQARVIYLLPYMLAILAVTCQIIAAKSPGNSFSIIMRSLVGLCFGFGALIVLLVRPMSALSHRPANDLAQIDQAMEQTVGHGPHRVLMEEWSAYYSARKLGWKMYLAGTPMNAAVYAEFLSGMDFVIVRANPIVHFTTTSMAKELKFNELAVLNFVESENIELSLGVATFTLSAAGYPAIRVYQNPRMNARD